ncbi:MAG TPA: hypothetical protein D7H92_03700 [Candidatus Poseidoniales archaeon]|nr:MAG TPA: hypothetical protein D7H92_03700 [Candidatus Poseidoniales archaeon]
MSVGSSTDGFCESHHENEAKEDGGANASVHDKRVFVNFFQTSTEPTCRVACFKLNGDATLADRSLGIVLALRLERDLETLISQHFRGSPNRQFPHGRYATLGHIFGYERAVGERESNCLEFRSVGDGNTDFVICVAVVLELERYLHLIALAHGPCTLIGDVQIDHSKGGDVEVSAHRCVGREGFGPVEHADIGHRGHQREVIGKVGREAGLSSEGDFEILFFVWAEVKRILFQHHVHFKAIPFLFHTDGFLERGGILYRAGDFNHRIVQWMDIEFGLLLLAINLNTGCCWGLSLNRRGETEQHQRHDEQTQAASRKHGPHRSLWILFDECDGELLPKRMGSGKFTLFSIDEVW